MKKRNFEKNTKALLLLIMSVTLIVGCAKKLPEHLSDDLENNVFPIQLFSEKVTVETYAPKGQESGFLPIETEDVFRNVYALNEMALFPVKMVKGNSALAPFLEDLTLEAQGPGERFVISFELTDNYLVAYKLNAPHVSNHLKLLSRGDKVPAFQFKIESYGLLERKENDLGELTRIVEFRPRHRQQATHAKIPARSENRAYAGIRGENYDSKNVVLNKEKLDGKIVKGRDAQKLFPINDILKVEGALSDNGIIRLKVIKDRLFLQIPTSFSDLNDFEREFLANGDERIEKCDAAIKKQTGIVDCYLRPAYSIKIEHVSFRPKTDRQDPLASIDIDRGIHPSQSLFVMLNLDTPVERDQLGQDLHFTDKVLLSKSAIDLEGEYLYRPITMGAPRDVRLAAPFLKGQEKVVKLKWSERGLEVFEAEKDERFAPNELNHKPVLMIPGSHKNFRCRQNANRECIGGDELDPESSWQDGRFFLASPESLNVRETNLLDPMTLDSPCLIHVETELVDHEFTNEAINIRLEKTYKTVNNFGRCLWDHYRDDPQGLSGLSNASFKAQFHYSMVKLDALVDKSYQKIDYPVYDQKEFGFFRSYEKSLGHNFDPHRPLERHLLNRWSGSGDPSNPRIIHYYLNDNHFKPENATILNYTELAEVIINDALEQANADIRVHFDTNTRGVRPGDLRKNMLILIDDPLANGLLGYGPSVKNPRTGEIVNAQTNMYSGVLMTTVRRAWQAMADHQARLVGQNSLGSFTQINPIFRQPGVAQVEVAAGDETEENVSAGSDEIIDDVMVQISGIDRGQFHTADFHVPMAPQHLEQKVLSREQLIQKGMLERLRRTRPSLNSELLNNENLSDVERMSLNIEERNHDLAVNNVFASDFFRVGGVDKEIPLEVKGNDEFFKIVNGVTLLKDWDELSISLQQEAMDIIFPLFYLGVFIHEIGHNLGLRHNFMGTYDKNNFYTKEEIADTRQRLLFAWMEKQNCANDLANEKCHPEFYERAFRLKEGMASSSIMDYSVSRLNELTIFGKYDIAALRFAYGRQVETASGGMVAVTKTLQEQFKEMRAQDNPPRDYSFCTDENAGLSPSCSRHEEGTSHTEIVRFYISSYHDNYRYSNFRDGRNEFSEFGVMNYAARRLWEFRRMRNIFESWEFLADILGEGIMIQGCSPEQVNDPGLNRICTMINDHRDSVQMLADFYLSLAKMPDHLCEVKDVVDEASSSQFLRLSELYLNGHDNRGALRWDLNYVPKSCFDSAVVEHLAENDLKVIGEGGRFLNGFKDNDPNFPYVSDRYVLGVWIDRALAVHSLFQRDSGMFNADENFRALVDIPSVMSRAYQMIEDMIYERPVSGGIPFRREDGSLYAASYALGLSDMVQSPHWMFRGLNQFFGLPGEGQEYFNKIFLNMIRSAGLTRDRLMRDQSIETLNLFQVRKMNIFENYRMPTQGGFKLTQFGEHKYVASKDNKLAYGIIDAIESFKFLEGVSETEVILEVIESRSTLPEVPEYLDGLAANLWDFPIEYLEIIASLPPGLDVGEDVFVGAFGPQLGPIFFMVYTELGPEGVQEILDLQEELRNTPPDDASEEMIALYGLDLEVLISYLEGELNDKTIATLKENLRLLHQHISL